MASHGRTIIMSIHQPRYSIYRLFDTLTLLVSGKMVYHGPAANALNYFANIGEYLATCDITNNELKNVILCIFSISPQKRMLISMQHYS